MRYLLYLLLALLSLTICTACKKRIQMPSNKVNLVDSSSAEMIKLNQLLVEVEQNEIKAYIDSSKLAFTPVDGYWIAKTVKGNGKQIAKNDIILLSYEVGILNGKTCYSYTGKKLKQVEVGKIEKQRGLNEALSHLQEGDEATIIVPANLAYGAIGDMNNIPPRATLIYTIFGLKKQ